MGNTIEEQEKYNGLWTVEFISTMNRSGKGVIVLKDGRLLGGDTGYYYTGSYEINFDTKSMTANIIVIRHDPNWFSVFGNIDSFKLSFSGSVDNLHFSAMGTIVGMPEYKIRIVGNKKEDL